MKRLLFIFIAFTILVFNSCRTKDMAIDRKNLDESIDPGVDFYQYANGGWIKNNPLPAEFSRYGSFDVLAEENNERVRKLVEEIAASKAKSGTVGQKVGDFYQTGMDSVKIEEEGIKPLINSLDELNSVSTKEALKSLLLKWQSENTQILFSLYGVPDKKNSEMVIASLSQGGLGLTDVDYYKAQDDRSKAIRSEYLKYISRILKLAGVNSDTSEIQAIKILEFETRLANASMSRLERRDPYKVYNKMSINELVALSPEINWKELISKLNINDLNEINVSQPIFFEEISKMLKDTELGTWKAWMQWSFINSNSELLSSGFVNANFDFYGGFLSGKKKLQPRWKRILANSNQALGEAIGELFVKKYFPPQSKEKMLALVGNLKIALAERINNLDWMNDSTKLQALDKLNAIIVKIGYPDKWRDYSPMEIGKTSYFENVRSASVFNYRYNINKIGKPVDKTEWGMTPQTVNAYYNPSRNEIVFPAAILQPPFFFPDADDAVNYGAIGMVIGHEMTHGFDDQGRNYDKNGNLINWWTNDDAEKFLKKTKVLVDHYNRFIIKDGVMADGNLTLGENIADLGGLNIAYTALLKAWEKNPPEMEIDGFTPSQRFFLAYAHVWANNISDEEMLRRTKEDVHSLGHLRVNGPLQHMQQFADAFDINTDEPMFIPQEMRAGIW
jgi:putative endopeptidase